jgi:futalosine hydrolase
MSGDHGDQNTSPEWLLLVPTKFELEFIDQSLAGIPRAITAVCGFGPVIAAARTVQLIDRHRPRRVLLLGIAGKLGSWLEVGQGCVFDQVSSYGIGLGSGASFQTAEEMGWLQWDGDDPGRSIGDTLPLTGTTTSIGQAPAHLLTVCSASASSAEIAQRQRRFPDAVAEDMEGFAVAAACKLCGLPISIVRGISNQAGDRDKRNWRIREAMQSAAAICQQITHPDR